LLHRAFLVSQLRLQRHDFDQSEPAVEANGSMAGIPLSLGLVDAVPAISSSVWHGSTLLVHLFLRRRFHTGLSEIRGNLLR
jgi:hypothetical protein